MHLTRYYAPKWHSGLCHKPDGSGGSLRHAMEYGTACSGSPRICAHAFPMLLLLLLWMHDCSRCLAR